MDPNHLFTMEVFTDSERTTNAVTSRQPEIALSNSFAESGVESQMADDSVCREMVEIRTRIADVEH